GAELAGSMPSADFTGSWGSKTIGSYWGHLGSISYAAFATMIIGVEFFPMGTYLHRLIPQLPVPVLGSLSFILTAIIVYFGAKFTGIMEVWINVVVLVVAAILVVAAFMNFDPSNFVPFTETGAGGIIAEFPFVIYVFAGPVLIFASSEENVPSRNFWPKAAFGLMGIILLIYITMQVSALGLLPVDAYSLDEATVATEAEELFGEVGLFAYSIIAYLAVFTLV